VRAFLALLLIGNIAFAVFQWFLPYDRLFVEERKVPAAEELQLLSQANTEIVKQEVVVAKVEAKAAAQSRAEPVAPQTSTPAVAQSRAEPVAPQTSTPAAAPVEPEPLVTEDVRDKRVCYTIGPLKDRARAIEISGRYSGKQIATTLKSSLEKQYQGTMVYIDGHKSRADALKTANKLSVKGIRDHFILSGPGRPKNQLSLGVFGLKKNLDQFQKRVQKLGFSTKTEARYRERTIYWIYAEQSSEDKLMRLLNEAEFDDGISQTPTQCLPI
jgi:hypothetical protein